MAKLFKCGACSTAVPLSRFHTIPKRCDSCHTPPAEPPTQEKPPELERDRSPRLRETIQDRFDRFHAANPKVLEMFARFARELKESGQPKGSAKLIVERMRWESLIETKSEDTYKINNDFTSRYARLAMEKHPDLKDFFWVRRVV